MAFSNKLNKAPPFLKTTNPRSRSPVRQEQQSLVLRRVIGTTTSSNNGFDAAEASSSFATTAGAGAVLATLGDDGRISQRFFHAKPAVAPLVTTPSIYDSPTSSSTQSGARSRAAASLRESGFGGLPASPATDSFDSPNAKAAANRTKAATCVALSPDGKLLAVGETGHRPRVLIFSTARDAPTDVPQNALSEHTFGVRCLAFSPDSQYLASLGDMNDGFLYVWSINQRMGTALLQASNKCTSKINQIAWMGNNLITVGTRHVKIWRLDDGNRGSPQRRVSEASFVAPFSPSSKTLSGRNCLLGPLLDKTFTSVAAISSNQAIVCSDTGDVCLLDDRDSTPSFTKIEDTRSAITTVAFVSSGRVLLAGLDQRLKLLNLEARRKGNSLPLSTMLVSDVETIGDAANAMMPAVAMRIIRGKLVLVDSTRGLKIFDGSASTDGVQMTLTLQQTFPAHRGAVLGLHSFPESSTQGAFITWSAEGTVLFWNSRGSCTKSITIPLEQLSKVDNGEYINELRVVGALGKGDYVVTGDRFGVLRVVELATCQSLYENKAHGNEITDIAVHENGTHVLVASASRDRTVQLFRWHGQRFEHLQTIEEHSGAVTNLLFAGKGRRLVSCSSDRTIMIMDAVVNSPSGSDNIVGFLTNRFITLKATPVSIDLVGEEKDTILVSTIDRQIQKYDLSSGSLLTSFKTSDQDGSDAVILSSAIHVPRTKRSSIIAGVSSTDKSIRIYEESGRLIGKEYGHTEGMTGIGLIPSDDGEAGKTLVTVASDGTIFVWDLLSASQQMQEMFATVGLADDTARSSPGFLATRPPLRKMISSQELTRLHGLREEPEMGGKVAKSIETPEMKGSLRRKTSRLTLAQTPKLEPPSYMSSKRSATVSPSAATLEAMQRRKTSSGTRAMSPESPNKGESGGRRTSRAPALGVPKAPKRRSMSAAPASSTTTQNGLAASSEAICRNLHAFRKKLATSSDMLALDTVREVERELSLTAKALAEKSSRSETVMAKILDQYSAKLVDMMDEKILDRIEATVARQMRGRRPSEDSNETARSEE